MVVLDLLSSFITVVSMLITVLSLAVVVIGGIVKLRWSKEFAKVKEAHIKQLQDEVQMLKDIIPLRLMEILKSSQELMGVEIDALRSQRDEAFEEARKMGEESRSLKSKVLSLELEIEKREGEPNVFAQATEVALARFGTVSVAGHASVQVQGIRDKRDPSVSFPGRR